MWASTVLMSSFAGRWEPPCHFTRERAKEQMLFKRRLSVIHNQKPKLGTHTDQAILQLLGPPQGHCQLTAPVFWGISIWYWELSLFLFLGLFGIWFFIVQWCKGWINKDSTPPGLHHYLWGIDTLGKSLSLGSSPPEMSRVPQDLMRPVCSK